ncbi:cytochrome P450 [Calocera viscosa TUFC12733]|uniref:Cytochrome P450 n=1 Tax=Calocera viscosa (strain TUFC12733) TaxID=1330018 RepID=A0A167JHR6_CALVF|nr:cytochrome P450 [Calocera viscosa TUFC12733]
MSWHLSFYVVLLLALVVNRVLAYRSKLAQVQHLPGPRWPFGPVTLISLLLPSSSWNGGAMLAWYNRPTLYTNYGSDTIAIVPWLYGAPMMSTRSVEVSKQVLGFKSDWEKTPELVAALAMFGENLFSCYKDRWSRHRRIVQPGFTNKLYAQVWDESVRVYYDMIRSEGWADKTSFEIPNVPAITSKIALYLIASCGFGLPLTWTDTVGEKVRGLTLAQCFETSAGAVIPQSILPRWMWNFPLSYFRRVKEANLALESIVRRIIEKRRQEGPNPLAEANEKDVFSLLLNANDAEKDTKAALTDQELVANVFLLMLAGHAKAPPETTSRGLGSTLGFLACNPYAQDKAYEEIMSVTGGVRDPTFEDYDSLPYTLGCFLEGTRLIPSVPSIPRQAAIDTSLKIPEKDGRTTTLPIRTGTVMVADFMNISFNPEYYPSPEVYDPARWLDPNMEPGINFSYGPRVCVGKKFALTESLATLSMLLKDYKMEPILDAGETLADWRRRSLEENIEVSVGFGPGKFPVRLVKRI